MATLVRTFVGVAWMGGILAGCGSDQGPIGAIASNGTVSPGASCEVFAPQTIRIHPLTHVDAVTDKGGARSVIVLHLELKDRYGDTVKWLGATQVTLSNADIVRNPLVTKIVQAYEKGGRKRR